MTANLSSFHVKSTRDSRSGPLEYHAYLPAGKTERVLVYIHGMISDLSWFEIPSNLPPGTAILYLPRTPRQDAKTYTQWHENAKACLEDFHERFSAPHYHLVANCFGSLLGLHWVLQNPETFSTLTVVNPPLRPKRMLGFRDLLKICLGVLFRPEKLQRCPLSGRHFSRIPEIMEFIDKNPGTEFHFSHRFYHQTMRLRTWLRKNLKFYPVPTHAILSSEDSIANYQGIQGALQTAMLPERVTYLYSDHYVELLPQKEDFWKAVFDFIRQYEPRVLSTEPAQTVLITGGSGFLGGRTVSELLASTSCKVRILARDTTKMARKCQKLFPDQLHRVEIIPGDLSDLTALRNATQGADAVIHTAGFISDWASPDLFRIANVDGTKNLLMLAHQAGIRQFIHVSSLGVFGDKDQFLLTENSPLVFSSDDYSNSKIQAEVFVRKYCRQYQIPFTVIRPGFIYGEGDNHFLPKMVKAALGNSMTYLGAGDNYLNTVYVGNVSRLILSCLGNPDAFYQSYNVTDLEKTTLREFYERVAEHLKVHRLPKRLPPRLILPIATVLEDLFRFVKSPVPPPLTRKKITFLARSRLLDTRKSYHAMGEVPYHFPATLEQTLNAHSEAVL